MSWRMPSHLDGVQRALLQQAFESVGELDLAGAVVGRVAARSSKMSGVRT